MKIRKELPDLMEQPPTIPSSWDVQTNMPSEGSRTPISVLDEQAFATECCSRLNAFLQRAPKDAKRILKMFIPFEHELEEAYLEQHILAAMSGDTRLRSDMPPGTQLGALLAGILQTRHGDGYHLRPIFAPDPEEPGKHFLLRFEVVAQEKIFDASKT